MKLAVDCRMIGSGGIGTYISSLIPFFLASEECLLLGKEDQISTWKNNKNAALCFCTVKMFSVKEMFFFPHNIVKEINLCDAFYTPYCSIPCGIHIPIFSTIHDVVFLDVKGLSSPLGVFIRKIIYKYAVYRSKVLFTVSEFSAARIRATLCVKHKNIVIAYDALPDWLNAKPLPVQKKKQLLFVGNIKRHKGLSTLLEAFNMAREKGLDAKLIIVGEQSGFRTADKAVSRLLKKISTSSKEISSANGTSGSNSIHFTGRITDEELFTLYRESALLVQPSLYEGFGLPPLEALSLGTRALVSDIPVFREIYSSFPVTYFKAGNSGDLCSKLLECMSSDWDSPPPSIPSRYSFAKSADAILTAIRLSQ